MEQITCISNCLSIGIVSLFVTICFLVCRNVLANKAKSSPCECDETIYTGEVTASNNILVNSGGGKVPIFELIQKSNNEETYITESGTIYRNKACQRCCEDGGSVCESCLSKDRIVILHEAPTNFSDSSAGRTDTRGRDAAGRGAQLGDEDDADGTKAGTKIKGKGGATSPAYAQPPAEGSGQTDSLRALSPQEREAAARAKGKEGGLSPEASQYGRSAAIGDPKSIKGEKDSPKKGGGMASPKSGVESGKSGVSSDAYISSSEPTVDAKGLKSAVSSKSQGAPSLSSDTKRSTPSSPSTPGSRPNSAISGKVPVKESGDSSSLTKAQRMAKAGAKDDETEECESICICGEEDDRTLTLKGKIKFGCAVCNKKYKCVCKTEASGVTTVHEVRIGVKQQDSVLCLCNNLMKGPHGAAAAASAGNKTYTGADPGSSNKDASRVDPKIPIPVTTTPKPAATVRDDAGVERRPKVVPDDRQQPKPISIPKPGDKSGTGGDKPISRIAPISPVVAREAEDPKMHSRIPVRSAPHEAGAGKKPDDYGGIAKGKSPEAQISPKKGTPGYQDKDVSEPSNLGRGYPGSGTEESDNDGVAKKLKAKPLVDDVADYGKSPTKGERPADKKNRMEDEDRGGSKLTDKFGKPLDPGADDVRGKDGRAPVDRAAKPVESEGGIGSDRGGTRGKGVTPTIQPGTRIPEYAGARTKEIDSSGKQPMPDSPVGESRPTAPKRDANDTDDGPESKRPRKKWDKDQAYVPEVDDSRQYPNLKDKTSHPVKPVSKPGEARPSYSGQDLGGPRDGIIAPQKRPGYETDPSAIDSSYKGRPVDSSQGLKDQQPVAERKYAVPPPSPADGLTVPQKRQPYGTDSKPSAIDSSYGGKPKDVRTAPERRQDYATAPKSPITDSTYDETGPDGRREPKDGKGAPERQDYASGRKSPITDSTYDKKGLEDRREPRDGKGAPEKRQDYAAAPKSPTTDSTYDETGPDGRREPKDGKTATEKRQDYATAPKSPITDSTYDKKGLEDRREPRDGKGAPEKRQDYATAPKSPTTDSTYDETGPDGRREPKDGKGAPERQDYASRRKSPITDSTYDKKGLEDRREPRDGKGAPEKRQDYATAPKSPTTDSTYDETGPDGRREPKDGKGAPERQDYASGRKSPITDSSYDKKGLEDRREPRDGKGAPEKRQDYAAAPKSPTTDSTYDETGPDGRREPKDGKGAPERQDYASGRKSPITDSTYDKKGLEDRREPRDGKGAPEKRQDYATAPKSPTTDSTYDETGPDGRREPKDGKTATEKRQDYATAPKSPITDSTYDKKGLEGGREPKDGKTAPERQDYISGSKVKPVDSTYNEGDEFRDPRDDVKFADGMDRTKSQEPRDGKTVDVKRQDYTTSPKAKLIDSADDKRDGLGDPRAQTLKDGKTAAERREDYATAPKRQPIDSPHDVRDDLKVPRSGRDIADKREDGRDREGFESPREGRTAGAKRHPIDSTSDGRDRGYPKDDRSTSDIKQDGRDRRRSVSSKDDKTASPKRKDYVSGSKRQPIDRTSISSGGSKRSRKSDYLSPKKPPNDYERDIKVKEYPKDPKHRTVSADTIKKDDLVDTEDGKKGIKAHESTIPSAREPRSRRQSKEASPQDTSHQISQPPGREPRLRKGRDSISAGPKDIPRTSSDLTRDERRSPSKLSAGPDDRKDISTAQKTKGGRPKPKQGEDDNVQTSTSKDDAREDSTQQASPQRKKPAATEEDYDAAKGLSKDSRNIVPEYKLSKEARYSRPEKGSQAGVPTFRRDPIIPPSGSDGKPVISDEYKTPLRPEAIPEHAKSEKQEQTFGPSVPGVSSKETQVGESTTLREPLYFKSPRESISSQTDNFQLQEFAKTPSKGEDIPYKYKDATALRTGAPASSEGGQLEKYPSERSRILKRPITPYYSDNRESSPQKRSRSTPPEDTKYYDAEDELDGTRDVRKRPGSRKGREDTVSGYDGPVSKIKVRIHKDGPGTVEVFSPEGNTYNIPIDSQSDFPQSIRIHAHSQSPSKSEGYPDSEKSVGASNIPSDTTKTIRIRARPTKNEGYPDSEKSVGASNITSDTSTTRPTRKIPFMSGESSKVYVYPDSEKSGPSKFPGYPDSESATPYYMPSGSSISKPESILRKTRSNTSSDASTADVDDFAFPRELLMKAGSDASLLRKYFSKKNPPNVCTNAPRLINARASNIRPCPGPQSTQQYDRDAGSRPRLELIDPSLITGISEKVQDCLLHARKLVENMDPSLSDSEYSGRSYPLRSGYHSEDEVSSSGQRKYRPYQQSKRTPAPKYATTSKSPGYPQYDYSFENYVRDDQNLLPGTSTGYSGTQPYVPAITLRDPDRRPVQFKNVEEQEQEYRDLLTTAVPSENASVTKSNSPTPGYPRYEQYRSNEYPAYSQAVPDPNLDVTDDEYDYVYEIVDTSASDNSMKNCYCYGRLPDSDTTTENQYTSGRTPEYLTLRDIGARGGTTDSEGFSGMPSASSTYQSSSDGFTEPTSDVKTCCCDANRCAAGRTTRPKARNIFDEYKSDKGRTPQLPSDSDDMPNIFDKYKTDDAAGKDFKEHSGSKDPQPSAARSPSPNLPDISDILNKYKTPDCAKNNSPCGALDSQLNSPRIPTDKIPDISDIVDKYRTKNTNKREFPPPNTVGASSKMTSSTPDWFGSKQPGTDLKPCTNPNCRRSPLIGHPSSPTTTERLKTPLKQSGKNVPLSKRPYTSPHSTQSKEKLPCDPKCTTAPTTADDTKSIETLYQTAKQLRNTYLPDQSKYNEKRDDIYRSKYCIGKCHTAVTEQKTDTQSKKEDGTTDAPSGPK